MDRGSTKAPGSPDGQKKRLSGESRPYRSPNLNIRKGLAQVPTYICVDMYIFKKKIPGNDLPRLAPHRSPGENAEKKFHNLVRSLAQKGIP